MTYKEYKEAFWLALEAHTQLRYSSSLIFWKNVRKMWHSGKAVDEAVRVYCGEASG